jgi:hypothetical protein
MAATGRTGRRAAAAAAAFALLAACGSGDDEGATGDPGTEAGADRDEAQALPAVLDFSAPTVDGGTIDGVDLAGQDLVLWFWAPW